MPRVALMRHGVAGKPPHGLKYGSCQQILTLSNLVALEGPKGVRPIVVHAEDHDSVETAKVVIELLEAEGHAHPALSDTGCKQNMDLFVGWLLNQQGLVIVITHRRQVSCFYKSLEAKTRRRIKTKHQFGFRFLHLFPKAILLDTKNMTSRVIRAKRSCSTLPSVKE